MMTFWDSIRGQRFADTLIRELPKLTERKRQYTAKFKDLAEMEKYLESAITDEECYVQHIVHDDGSVFLVMQK